MATEKLHQGEKTGLVMSTLLINGEELSGVYKVVSISVYKEINRIPTATIVLLDGSAAQQDFDLSNTNLLIPGNKIEIQTGYYSKEETIFKGMVIKHSLKIRSQQSYLIIECKDEAIKLTIGRKTRYFYESKDSDIFGQLGKSYGLETAIEPTKTAYPELVQYDVTDWDFMITRVQANGMICVADDGVIKISAPNTNQDPLAWVAYGDNIYEFDAEIDARNSFKKITAFGWDATEQELIDVEAHSPDIDLNGNLDAKILADTIKLENLELKGGLGKTKHLQDWADAKALFQRLSKIRGRIKVPGAAKIKPDSILELKGVGDRFNGRVFVSGIRHEISDGKWMSDVQFGIDPVWFTENYNSNPLPASGLFPAVNGLQIGIITQLEDDPEKENRIKIRLPMINDNDQGIWARIATLDAGENRGSFFLPEIDDEVIVGFINDNPQEAVILGMLHSSAKPAPIRATDDNHEKGFVTRSQMKFVFNDENKSISIETPGGKKIVVDEDKNLIQIEDEHANKVMLDADGISMESNGGISLKVKGDLNLEGKSINLKANTLLTASGQAGVELSTSAVAVIKGSLVQIN